MKKFTKLLAAMFAVMMCVTLATPVMAEAATIKKPTKVTSVKKSVAKYNTIKVTYKKAARAKGYQVQYSTKSSMKSAKTTKTTKTFATIKSLKANTTYYIRVRAYNTSSKRKTQYGAWSSKIKIKTEVAKPGTVTLHGCSYGCTSIAPNYSKASGAKGYQIQYSTKSNMASAKTIKSTKTSATINGVKANTTYYIRVRAYNKMNSGKTQYGAWSKTLKIKTMNHDWMDTYDSVRCWVEYQLVYVGVKDLETGTVYPDYAAFKAAYQARHNNEQYLSGTFQYIYDTQETWYMPGTEPSDASASNIQYATLDFSSHSIWLTAAAYTAASKEFSIQVLYNERDGTEITALPLGPSTTMIEWHWWEKRDKITSDVYQICRTCGIRK